MSNYAQTTLTKILITPVLLPLANSFTALFPSTSSLLQQGISFLTEPFTRDISPFASVGSYTLNWATEQYKCWISQWITFLLLAALQAVNWFWMFLILRVLYRVVSSRGEEKRDERSDEDEEEVEEREGELRRMREEQKGKGWADNNGSVDA